MSKFVKVFENILSNLPEGYDGHYSIEDRTLWVWQTGTDWLTAALYRSKSGRQSSRRYHLYVQTAIDEEWEVGHYSDSHVRGQGIVNRIVRALNE